MESKEQDIFSINIKLFQSIFDTYLNEYVERDSLFARLKTICDEFEAHVKEASKSAEEVLNESKLGVIIKVYNRLLLISTLEKDPDNNSLNFKGYAFPGLITYLLLTCFDLLGQRNTSWKFFPDWLRSKKCISEVRDARLKIIKDYGVSNENEIDPLKFSESLFNEYQAIYGIKNTFFNFITTILPDVVRKNFLDCIIIEKIITEEHKIEIIHLGDLEKCKWLFNLRNSYTHNLHTHEKNFIEGLPSSQGNLHIWSQSIKIDSTTTYYTKENFKVELKKAVIFGLLATIKCDF